MTSDIDNIIRPEIAGLKPYVSPSYEWRVKLDLNESPFDVPPEVKREIWKRVKRLQWQRYHDEFERPLVEKLADYENHDPDGVLIGNGSNELIFHSLLSVIRHGDTVLFPEPTFSLYRQNITVLGGQPESVMLNEADFSLNPDKLLAKAGAAGARAIVLCSPNNPTANLIPNEDIERVCREFGGLVLVDEAYTQFADGDAFELLERCQNLAILRTFSKAFGLAGLRFGYLLARPELAREIDKVQLPHHVSFFTQLAASTLIENAAVMKQRVESLKRERDSLIGRLDCIAGVSPLPSQSNFILIECTAVAARELFERLLARGVLIRNVSNYTGLARYLRITVGTPEENRVLIRALEEVLA
ncbi:MAG: histidinol-phosphate transaminase [Candidatus Glassbacteria bacterium]|nr:histidinol-phosphate transaminase [Candidatus Glassbacteria bacterium]